jgi:hypothetical protein
MRYLATLGVSGLIAAMTCAQSTIRTEFAIDRPGAVVETTSVTVLPLPVPPPPGVLSRPAYDPEQLLRMSEPELIDLYKCSRPAPVPTTYTPGLVIFKPGSCITVPMARVLECTAWQGKYFPCEGTMVNRQFGLPTIKANIYAGESWLDGGPSTVFDYADTSLVCTRYRDEVREVCPGVYLGIMHRRCKSGPKVATWFALDARTGKGCCMPTGK